MAKIAQIDLSCAKHVALWLRFGLRVRVGLGFGVGFRRLGLANGTNWPLVAKIAQMDLVLTLQVALGVGLRVGA